MVDGCKTQGLTVVVDLDGTLVSVNTFREYILFAVKCLLRRLRLVAAMKVALEVIARKLRLISHSEMKRRILLATQGIVTEEDIDTLTRRLLSSINTGVMTEIERYRSKGYGILLATAAPERYAAPIADALRFDSCVATLSPQHDDSSWHENVGEAKLASVEACLAVSGGIMSVVMTDHHDDIPLMLYNGGTNILVNPSEKSVEYIKRYGISFNIL